MKPTVSIIVPIYNAEEYLNRCIDSILTQEYTDFELILANDGSKDSSGDICDSYAAADPRVRVIHKPNTGVSDTRNIAIREAQGTYLQFLDSDDWITPDATKLLVRSATEHNCDLVIADFYRVVGERVSHKGDIEDDGVLTREEFAAHMMENPADFYYGVLWNKLYRRDIIEKYHLEMDTSISWCEDFLFNLEYMLHAQVFYALQAPIYYYIKRKGSLASQGMNISKTIKMKFMVFEYYKDFYKNVYDEKDYEKKRLGVYRFFVDAAGDDLVPPALLPGVSKLGNERRTVYPDALSNEGLLGEYYRHRKLLERYLETVGLRYDLTLKEVTLLLYLSQTEMPCSRKNISDYTDMSKNSLAITLQRLVARDFIKITEVHTSRKKASDDSSKLTDLLPTDALQVASTIAKSSSRLISIELLPATLELLPYFETVENDFDAARFEDFTEDELAQYKQFSDRIKHNIQKKLTT